MDSQEANIIAYLAPEIPALSATFVYNEIFGLEIKKASSHALGNFILTFKMPLITHSL